MRARLSGAMAMVALVVACTDHMQLLGPGLEDGAPPDTEGRDGNVPPPSSDGAMFPSDGPATVSDAPACPPLPITLPTFTANTLGDGTLASCTAQAFAERVARGGLITFNCGDAPLMLVLPSNLIVSTNTMVDGGDPRPGAEHRVTLQAGTRARAFTVRSGSDASQTVFVLKNVTLTGGQAIGGATADDRAGGAILNSGALVVVQSSTLSVNRSGNGGAIAARGLLARVFLTDTTLVSNTSSGNGGALDLDGGELWIAHSKIQSNFATGNGGGMYIASRSAKLSICGSSIQSNTAAGQFSGGLYFSATLSGEATIDQSTFASNSVGSATTGSGQGGAMYTQGAAVTLRASTISGNHAGWVAGAWVGAFGDTNAPGALTMENVTIADNQSYENATMGFGSGLWLAPPVTGIINNCTIANNEGSFAAGIATGGTIPAEVVVSNSIIANVANVVPHNCTQVFATGGAPNLQWPIDTATPTVTPVRCGGNLTVLQDPGLGPLTENGGPTQTMSVAASSPAAGVGVGCLAFDQRGFPRRTMRCTLGAYEAN